MSEKKKQEYTTGGLKNRQDVFGRRKVYFYFGSPTADHG